MARLLRQIRASLEFDHFPGFPIDFFTHKFAACSKPPSRDDHSRASYPKKKQSDQGAGWTCNQGRRKSMIALLIRLSAKHGSGAGGGIWLDYWPVDQNNKISTFLALLILSFALE